MFKYKTHEPTENPDRDVGRPTPEIIRTQAEEFQEQHRAALEERRRLYEDKFEKLHQTQLDELRGVYKAATTKPLSTMGDNRGLPIAKDIAHRPDPKQPLKYDSAEAPMYRGALWYFPKALNAVAQVSAAGAKKYDWNKGWLAGDDAFARYSDALVRHLGKEAYEKLDSGPKGTGLLHAAHVAWNALARLEVMLYAEGLEPLAPSKEPTDAKAPPDTATAVDNYLRSWDGVRGN